MMRSEFVRATRPQLDGPKIPSRVRKIGCRVVPPALILERGALGPSTPCRPLEDSDMKAMMAIRAAMLLAVAGVSTAAYAQAAEEPKPEATVTVPSEVIGDVVSVGTEAKTVTLKFPAGDAVREDTLTVEGDGVAGLSQVKAGDRIAATCREGTSNDKCVVTSVRKLDVEP